MTRREGKTLMAGRKKLPDVEILPDEEVPMLLTARPKEINRMVNWEDLHEGRPAEYLRKYDGKYYGPHASLE